jgi:hypothetical protein
VPLEARRHLAQTRSLKADERHWIASAAAHHALPTAPAMVVAIVSAGAATDPAPDAAGAPPRVARVPSAKGDRFWTNIIPSFGRQAASGAASPSSNGAGDGRADGAPSGCCCTCM